MSMAKHAYARLRKSNQVVMMYAATSDVGNKFHYQRTCWYKFMKLNIKVTQQLVDNSWTIILSGLHFELF